MKKILQYPFTKDCQWWAPIELITRLLLIIFIIVDVGNLVSNQICAMLLATINLCYNALISDN